MSLSLRRIAGLASAIAAVACGTTYAVGTYDRTDVSKSLESDAGLVLGEFPLAKGGVVDGDTVKVGGLDASLRLLAMDTEETFKSEKARRSYEKGWEHYLEVESAKTNRPIKVATPLGEEAKRYAKAFFEGVSTVRLERDHPKEIKGRFGRFLVYVFVQKDGEWINYNLEAVRAGMSPYFTKYGMSRRFHDAFVQAQEEAKKNQRGIWDPSKEHYTDYEARLKWWNARGKFVHQFERKAEGRDDYIILTNWDSMRRLQAKVGKTVSVLATVGEIRESKAGGPTKAMLSRRMFSDVPAVFFDPYVYEDSKIENYKGEYVIVRGPVNEWENPHNGRRVLQIRVDVPTQVTVPTYVPPGSDAAASKPPPKPEPAPPEKTSPQPAELPDGGVLGGLRDGGSLQTAPDAESDERNEP